MLRLAFIKFGPPGALTLGGSRGGSPAGSRPGSPEPGARPASPPDGGAPREGLDDPAALAARLLDEHFDARLRAEARAPPDEWRVQRLYVEPVDKVLRRHEKPLAAAYMFYATQGTRGA